MAVALSELEQQRKRMEAERYLPHIPSLTEMHRELYSGKEVVFFPHAYPTRYDSSLNINQLSAGQHMMDRLRSGEGQFYSVFGPMWGGKTAMAALMTKGLEGRTQVFQHQFGFERFEVEELTIKGHERRFGRTGIPATTFSDFQDLREKLEPIPGSVVLADEFQFCDVSSEELSEWKTYLADNGMQAVVFALDLTFLGRPWERTMEIREASDGVVVMAAQCDEGSCLNPAFMTKRVVVLKDGRQRPACETDPIELVGVEVAGEGKGHLDWAYYTPACWEHFDLFTEEQAAAFDSQGA